MERVRGTHGERVGKGSQRLSSGGVKSKVGERNLGQEMLLMMFSQEML